MSSRSRGGGGDGGGDHRSTPPNIDTMHSLKVDNLTYRTRVEDLRRYFDKYGQIGDIYIPRDQFSRSSRGYAFIRFVFGISNWENSIFSRLVTLKNVMPKMHAIGWTVSTSMDVKSVFNLLVMAVRQQTIVINHVVVGMN